MLSTVDRLRGVVPAEEWRAMPLAEQETALRHGYVPSISGGSVSAPSPANTPGGRAQPAAMPAASFVQSAHEHVEPAFTLTATQATSVVQFNPQSIPAYGYARHVFLEIACTGGAGGTGNADYPWNLLQSVTLQDVNGGNIVGPMDGYALYLANLFGGYSYNNNPANAPYFVGSAPNPVFHLRVPIEVSARDGLGAIANQNASANYQLSLTLNTIANTTSVAYTTAPVVTIRGWLEAWTLPAPADNRGRPQAQTPPLLGTGQYWSVSGGRSILVGSNTQGLTRLGNLVRLLIFVFRDATGARADAVAPDPVLFNWDGVQLFNGSQRYFQQYLFEKLSGAIARPAGVFVFSFAHGGEDNKMGNETPDLWLPTSQSSRLELTGVSASAGNLQIITNEVAPLEIDAAARFQAPSDTGSLVQAAGVAG